MKTNYTDAKTCRNCAHVLNEYGALTCMKGETELPPDGRYVGPNDSIGFASIYKKEEADFYANFMEEHKVDELHVCDDYEPNKENQ